MKQIFPCSGEVQPLNKRELSDHCNVWDLEHLDLSNQSITERKRWEELAATVRINEKVKSLGLPCHNINVGKRIEVYIGAVVQ